MPTHRAMFPRTILPFSPPVLAASVAHAQAAAQRRGQVEAQTPTIEIYGFAMLDMGYHFGQNNPDWFDVVRPTKLPAFLDSSARTAVSMLASGSRASA